MSIHNNQSVSQAKKTIDKIQTALIILSVICIVSFFVVLYYLWWGFFDYLEPEGNVRIRIWAMVATSLLPIAMLLGGLWGYALGSQKGHWMIEGARSTIERIAPQLKDLIDVRVYGFNRLWHKESTGSQELDLSTPPILPRRTEQDQIDL